MSKKNINNLNETDTESDSDESIDENLGETSVDVGLIDVDLQDLTDEEKKLNRILLKSPFFPSKVGGKPAWLDYSNLPLANGSVRISNNNHAESSNQMLKCNNCNTQLIFLLQIYAPISSTDKYYDQIENIDEAFHRVLYVFVCANTECAPAKSRTLKVFRSQLSRKNDYFLYDAPPTLDDGEHDLDLSTLHLTNFYKNLHEKNLFNLCSVCGLYSNKKCARCSFSFYCCQAHQVFDWTKANHKETCPKYINKLAENNLDDVMKLFIDCELFYENNINDKQKNNFLFPQYEILIEPEVLDFTRSNKDNKEFKYDEQKVAQDLENNDGIDQDLDNIKESDYDKEFEKFQKYTSKEPTQVIRYERGGKPLWVTKYEKLNEKNVPTCNHCGSNRIFEFQINPQLLSYLNLDEAKQLNSIDWAGLYIFTCKKSCKAANNSYIEEFIYKQEFVS